MSSLYDVHDEIIIKKHGNVGRAQQQNQVKKRVRFTHTFESFQNNEKKNTKQKNFFLSTIGATNYVRCTVCVQFGVVHLFK